MKDTTYEKIENLWYNTLLAENIEIILSNYMITNHDNMIIDILKEIENFNN